MFEESSASAKERKESGVLELFQDAGLFRNNVCELKESCELPTITQFAAISILKDFPELL